MATKPKFRSTKTYGHDVGLSCAFRQWKATHSHCSQLHGYALSFKFVFEAEELDNLNWVMDFGAFGDLKERLKYLFDHTTAVARNDPHMPEFEHLADLGLITLRKFRDGVGCEMFAKAAFDEAKHLLKHKMGDRVRLVSCEVCEHGANSAIYMED